MAHIKVPYTYKSYPYCPQATFVSLHTHKPSSTFLIGTLVMIILCGIGILIYNGSGQELESFGGAVSTVLILGGFLAWFIVPLILPKLSDHFQWSDKVAAKYAAKLNNSGQ